MKVKELIDALRKTDPNSLVEYSWGKGEVSPVDFVLWSVDQDKVCLTDAAGISPHELAEGETRGPFDWRIMTPQSQLDRAQQQTETMLQKIQKK